MPDEWIAKHVRTGRLSAALVARRSAQERPATVAEKPSGASRGLLANHLGDHVRFIRGAIKFSGLWQRGRRNARAVRVNRHSVNIPGLPNPFQNFTLMHLSDLHLDVAPDMAAIVRQAVMPLTADATVITGDFRAATHGPVQPAQAAFAEVYPHLPQPVYAVLGNHDSLELARGLEELGVRLLFNEHALIEREGARLAIAGVDDPHYFCTDDLAAALANIPTDVVKILLAHSPEIYAKAASAGVDFMLAGHTHGGQICLPGGIPVIVNAECPRRYCRGFWRHGKMSGFTSAGTGSSVIDVRFNCPPEVVIHTLESKAP